MSHIQLRTGIVVLAGLCSGVLAERPAAQTRAVDLRRLEGPKVVVSEGNRVRDVAANAPTTTIRPNQYLVARWAPGDAAVTPVRPGSSNAWTTGFGFISVTSDGRERRFRPIIETTGGLQVVQDANGFRGQVFVGLVDLRDPAATYELPRPVSLLVTGDADSVSPRQLQIDHTNLPFTEVTVSARNPGDALELHLRANGTDERATVRLPVDRPRLDLAASGPVIQGFGLESVRLIVRAVGVQRPAGRVVTLSSTRGYLSPVQVVLDEEGTGAATLRSTAVGPAAISASSPPFIEASTRVRFTWPIALVVAAIVGGVAGGAIRRVRSGGQLRDAGALRSVVVWGLLSGLVVLALYVAAANVLPAVPTAAGGQGLAFVLAAVGGFLGSRPSTAVSSRGAAQAAVPATSTGTKKVFLSYRRDDAADITGRIFDHLVRRFGRERVFMDVDSIDFGADFRRQISDALDETGVLLAIVGDEWAGPRLADPDDYVAVEIGAALARDIPVIPVLVEGARMPAASELPAALTDLAYRNAADVRSGRDFPYHVGRLADSVAALIDTNQPTVARNTQ